MKTFKRVLSLVSAIALIATMLSCAFTVAFADSTLDAELAALTKQEDLSGKFNVTNGTNGYYIATTSRNKDVTAVSQNTFNLFENFVLKYSANYNYGVNAFNHEEHYTAIGDFRFAIDTGVKGTESIKYKLYYGETVLATYDTGVIGGTDSIDNVLSSTWDPTLTITITVNNGYVSVNSNKLGDITWTLADNSTATSVALPAGYDFNNVNVTLFYDATTSSNPSGWGQNVFCINQFETYFPYDTVDAFNAYLADVDPNDADEIVLAKYLKEWACDGTSEELQASLVAIGANSGKCVHDYTYTTTATCTQDGVRTYVCGLCGDTYTEDEPAFGHTEEVTSGNYATKSVCTVCGETLEWKYLGRNSTYSVTSTNLDTKSVITFDSSELFVSDNANDKAVLASSWNSNTFSYTLDGIAVTGKINEITFVLNGETVHRADTAVGSDTYEFLTAGRYYIYGVLTDITDAEGTSYPDQTVQVGSVRVRDYIYVDYSGRSINIDYGKNPSLDDVVVGDPSTNAFYLKADGVEVDSLYYLDSLYCNHWWKDYTSYTITLDGQLYKGFVSKIQYYNALTGERIGSADAHVWNGNAGGVNNNKKNIDRTGLWYVTGVLEGLKLVSDSTVTHDNISGITLGSFYVTTYQGDTHIHDYEGTVEKAATCTETGIMHYVCECGEDYYSVIPVLGHNYTSVVTTEPTCYSTGVKTYTCTRGDDTYTETLPVVDHDYVKGYCRFCGIREQYTPTAAEWTMSFVDAKGNVISDVSTANGDFWMVVGLTNYDELIGEMNLVMNGSSVDVVNSTYDRTIAFATTLISMDGTAVAGVRDDNNKIVYSTPYEGATLIANYDSEDGLLKVVFQSDENAGCTFSVSASDLDANNGELFRIKLTNKLTAEGAIDLKFVEESKLVSSSVALVNKPTAGEWETGVSYASELEFDVRGYDTIYSVDVTAAPVGPTYVETLIIPGLNVKFESDYTLGVYVAKDVYESYNEAYIVAKKEIYNGNDLTGYDEVTLKDATLAGNYYIFEYAGFAAREMSSMVSLTLNAKDADGKEYYGPEKTYSLKTYAMNQLGKSTTKATFKTMMVDFLNYGAAAQTYFGYNTANLANADADEYQSLATADRTLVKCTAGTDDSSYETQIVGFNLEFVSKINIAAYVRVSDDKAQEMQNGWYAVVSYTDFDNQAVTKRVDLSDEASFFKAGNYWIVTFNGLASKEMSTAVTFTLYDANGVQKSNAATYSIESYAASKSTSSTANLPELVKSMMKFGDAAAAYFA